MTCRLDIRILWEDARKCTMWGICRKICAFHGWNPLPIPAKNRWWALKHLDIMDTRSTSRTYETPWTDQDVSHLKGDWKILRCSMTTELNISMSFPHSHIKASPFEIQRRRDGARCIGIMRKVSKALQGTHIWNHSTKLTGSYRNKWDKKRSLRKRGSKTRSPQHRGHGRCHPKVVLLLPQQMQQSRSESEKPHYC